MSIGLKARLPCRVLHPRCASALFHREQLFFDREQCRRSLSSTCSPFCPNSTPTWLLVLLNYSRHWHSLTALKTSTTMPGRAGVPLRHRTGPPSTILLDLLLVCATGSPCLAFCSPGLTWYVSLWPSRTTFIIITNTVQPQCHERNVQSKLVRTASSWNLP